MYRGRWAGTRAAVDCLKALDRRAGDRAIAGLTCKHWRGSSLQKEQERRRAGGGFARSHSDT